ncbi:MAG: hypothetical protein B6D77_04825 [gamma proteobacterium symbiont of Ctena orbiculata]|nr:MAG: hypothetical protein B6D77_04825 [gamma proteobacterium symbiont of Ctena orbiculata]PVV17559.1 MAG: hypothetical protein B6D78_18465 [gamma proteobacterium symbiont of Ctena orbiculata]PVV27129.1 MAG: hypothetical protein B6D79_04025 [gamma proteobacterium symbiont of Ctena orbiculata]
MNTLELAKKYLNIFFITHDFESLDTIFDQELDFSGPFFESKNLKVYMDSLVNDPPDNCQYELVEEYDNGESACLVYHFTKAKKSTLMSQLFWSDGGKIIKIRLIFDPTKIT